MCYFSVVSEYYHLSIIFSDKRISAISARAYSVLYFDIAAGNKVSKKQ